jgi:hypothetical protein
MKILVGCEESQAVTIELRKLGHEAYSCDLLPCSGGHPEWHLNMCVFEAIKLINPEMGIFFPPCTDLAVSGAAHFKKKIANGNQQKSIKFFMDLVNAPIERIAIENPIGIMSSIYRDPDQIIQPYQFGDKAQKSTCLWLKNINPLTPTNIVEKGEFFEWVDKKGKNKRQPKWYYDAIRVSTTPEQRRTLRSKTFPGIAKAMAEQFTQPLKQLKLF